MLTDVGVVGFGEDDGQVGGAFGHLQGDVVAVVGKTGHLGERRGPRTPRAVDLRLTLEVVGDVGHGLLAAHDLGGGHDGIDQGFVAGAAADVVVRLEPVPDLFASGRRILGEKTVGGHDEAGGAEAALGAAVGDPGLLQRMQVLRRADALDGGDLAELGHALHLLGAGPHHFAVQDDGAGAADAGAAADLDAGEAHPP